VKLTTEPLGARTHRHRTAPYVYVVYFVMYDSVLILLLSYGHPDWFNKVFFFF